MAYYIIYFNGQDVIDVCKYAESEYEYYLKQIENSLLAGKTFQYGYF